jgi:hypothetical protein
VKLTPLDGDRDLAITGGYGVGWAPSTRFVVAAGFDVGFGIHPRAGIDADRKEMTFLMLGRLVVRYGVGS